jgi:hypothetical protein
MVMVGKQKAKNMTTNNLVYIYTEEERELDKRAQARAEAWMKVMRDATMAQRPHLYSQAVAMPALDATRSDLAWFDNLAGWYRRLLIECDNKADDKADDAINRIKGYISPDTYDKVYNETYAKWLPKLLARALKAYDKRDPAA